MNLQLMQNSGLEQHVELKCSIVRAADTWIAVPSGGQGQLRRMPTECKMTTLVTPNCFSGRTIL